MFAPPSETPSQTLLGSGGSVAGNESLEFKESSLLNFSKQGSTPTPFGFGLRVQIQKWALQTQKTLYF